MNTEWQRFSEELKTHSRKAQKQIVNLRADINSIAEDKVRHAMSIEIKKIIAESIMDYKRELQDALNQLALAKKEAEEKIKELKNFDVQDSRRRVNCTLRY